MCRAGIPEFSKKETMASRLITHSVLGYRHRMLSGYCHVALEVNIDFCIPGTVLIAAWGCLSEESEMLWTYN